MYSLKLTDYQDRELLHVVEGETDEKTGWANVADIAKTLNVQNDNATRCVGSRLAGMKRFGVVKNKKGVTGHWQVTPKGKRYMNGKLSPEEQEMLAGMDAERDVMLMRAVTERYRNNRDLAGRNLVSREWRFGTHGIKR